MRFLVLVVVLLAACATEPARSQPSMERRAPTPATAPRAERTWRRVELGAFEAEGFALPGVTTCIPSDERPLPLLYAFDGEAFVDGLGLCELVATLTAADAIPPHVVVGVPSTEQRTEMLARHPERLAELLVEHVEPRLASHVVLATGPRARALLGYSYGGLAALRIALASPERFGVAIAMSPSLWYGGRDALRRLRRADALPARIYVDVGSLEGNRGDVVPYAVQDARDFVTAIADRGRTFGRDVALREIASQVHDMGYARGRLPGALRFALGDALDVAPRSVAIRVDEPRRGARERGFAIDADYGDVVITWPARLASASFEGRALREGRIASRAAGTLRASVAGVEATRVLDPNPGFR